MKPISLTFFYDSFRSIKRDFLPVVALLVTSFSLLVGCSSGDSSDPVVVDKPVVYIERPLIDEDGEVLEDDALEPQDFRGGAILYLKDKATVDAQSIDISSSAFSGEEYLNEDGELLYDVRDLGVSYDGKKLLFSLRAPQLENVDEEDQPTWNIWEYDLETQALRRIFDDSLNVRAEDGHDMSPSYLPDGRILFTSTRQTQTKATLLDEGKDRYPGLDENRNVEAFNLHIMDEDGQNITQVTFNQSHDLDPVLLSNGKILFSRWDNAGGGRNRGINLYEINTDGTGLNYLYGRHSHRSGDEGSVVQFLDPKELDDGSIAVSLREFDLEQPAIQTTIVDIENYTDYNVEVDGTEHEENVAQSAIVSDLNTNGDLTTKGIFDSFSSLYDDTGRYVVSWSLCRVRLIDANESTEGNQAGEAEACTDDIWQDGVIVDEAYEAEDPFYGLYIYDTNDETLKLIEAPRSDVRFDEVRLITERPDPDYIEPATYTGAEGALASEGFGIVHIRSVYDFDGALSSEISELEGGLGALADPAQTAPADRPRQFLRVIKPVSIPSDEVLDFDNSAYGRDRNQGMRDILGYVPIEPDGSVKFAVPANVAFSINVLDIEGQRIDERHRAWLHVAPGETLECKGCHTANSTAPHGRSGAGFESINSGAETTGLPFPNTDPTLFADMSETMAETYSRINGIRRLTPDIEFEDVWTDAEVTALAPDFAYRYEDLETSTPVPASGCEDWSSLCRITINYENHIHPLWSVDRRVLDNDEMTVLEDRTCIACHTNTEDVEVLEEGETEPSLVTQQKVPDAQLDLTNGQSTDEPNHLKSYRELLFNDNQQELVDGFLVDELRDTDQPMLDEDGDPLLDEDGEVIFVQETIPVTRSMNQNGAQQSTRFFDVFAVGASHNGYMSTAELRLISEWLDIGAQYFNNPFAAPLD